MAFATATSAARPLSTINTTPLIDVLLVLLVMLVITIPAATHSIDVDIPKVGVPTSARSISNRLRLDGEGGLSWNGIPISDPQLAVLLERTRHMTTIPELQFEPAADVAYARSEQVLAIIKRSGIANFGFVGSERYARFGRAD